MKTIRLILTVSFIVLCGTVFGQQVIVQAATTPVVSSRPTSSAPVAVVDNNQLPPQIVALGSEEELFSYALSTAQWVDIWLGSQVQVGDSFSQTTRISGATNMAAIKKVIAAADAKIKVSGIDYVSYSIRVRDASYSVSISGGQGKKPVMGKAGLDVLAFDIELSLEQSVLILWKGLRSVKGTYFDVFGNANTFPINVDENGFRFQSNAAGKVLLEITDSTGKVSLYDLRKAAAGSVLDLSTSVNLMMRNLVSINDASDLILVPDTIAGEGQNVLGEVVLTKALVVKLAGRTTENKNAVGFKWRQTDSSVDTDWSKSIVPADSNGLGSVSFPGPGTYHVLALFRESDLRPHPFVYYFNNGKGG